MHHTNNLSKTVQLEFSVLKCQEVARLVVNTLEPLSNEDSFYLFWENLEKVQGNFEVDLPVLPRKRRCTARFDDGKAVGDHPATTHTLYRQYYYEYLDLIINCKSRFEQPGYDTNNYKSCSSKP